MPVSERDVEVASASEGTTGSGRNVIAVIGIDRYHRWQRLSNAVRDATGAAALFQRLGFEEVTAPLLDERATGKAIQSLVTDDLLSLGPDDSLVLFYAGHGGTRKHRLGGEEIKTGYLIPVDASGTSDKVSTWVELEGWLRAVSLLPAKHILVVLDACHSGIALDPIIKWRDIGSWQDAPLSTLNARRSRRIITSALDDQVALDSGPVHGHSLFTGCLIEGLTDGIRRGGSRVTTGSELGLYVQRRVQAYPRSRQTPDFGTFAFDDRGEMVIPLAIESAIEAPAASEAGSPAWLDLIDLDDKPEPASEVESRPSNAAFGTKDEVGSERISTAEPDLASPDGWLAKPAPAFDAGPRSDDADAGGVADDVAADRPEPGSAPPAVDPTASPIPSPSPQTVVPPPRHVASIVLNPELAEPGTAEPVPLQTAALDSTAISTPSSPPNPIWIRPPRSPSPQPTEIAVAPRLEPRATTSAEPETQTSTLPRAASLTLSSPPNPVPRQENVASIVPTRTLAEPASAEPASTPTPGSRRKRATLVLPPLLSPQAKIAKPTVSTPDTRRWIVAGVVGATLATALFGYFIFGQESSRGDSPVDRPPSVAASSPPDARPADAASSAVPEGPPDAQPQPGGLTAGGCPAGMVRVPAWTFRMGSPENVGDADEHPQHEVTLSAYCIDRTEVTVKAYAACVAAKGCSAAPLTVSWSGIAADDVKRYSRFCNRDDHPDHPINCVDWNQAAAYCKWADKRLPTEAEWEYAARGTDGRAYPWGNEAPSAKRLNACGSECVVMAKRELNLDWKSMYDASDGWASAAPVGSFLGDVSPFGGLDMAGNVAEWTADWYGAYTAIAAPNPRGAQRGSARVVRGGAWFVYDAADVRAAVRSRNDASGRSYNVGFRCARGD